MLTEMVNAVPLNAGGAVKALREENCAESPITAKPHIMNIPRKKGSGRSKNSGETRQRIPESIKNL